MTELAFKLPSAINPPPSEEEREDNIDLRDVAADEGLIVIRFREWKPEQATVNGVADAACADVLYVTGRHAGTRETDRLIFNAGVISVLKNADPGDVIPGRMQMKKVKSGRMVACLEDPRPGDIELARDALAGKAPRPVPAPRGLDLTAVTRKQQAEEARLLPGDKPDEFPF